MPVEFMPGNPGDLGLEVTMGSPRQNAAVSNVVVATPLCALRHTARARASLTLTPCSPQSCIVLGRPGSVGLVSESLLLALAKETISDMQMSPPWASVARYLFLFRIRFIRK